MVPPVRRLPPEQQHVTPRERKLLIGVAVVLALAGAGTAVATVAESHADRQNKCVTFNIGSSTGGFFVRHCGADAQQWCATEKLADDRMAREAQPACAAAGYKN